GLSMFAREHLGELVHVVVQKLDEPHENTRPALRIGCSPSRLSRLGRFDGRVQFCVAGKRYRALHFARCWIEHVRGTAACSVNPLAADKMTDLIHGCSSKN